MKITVNGAAHEFVEPTTLAGLIEQVAGTSRGSAAAVDGEVVPRGEWSSFPLQEGQSIEVLTAVQGG
jgi:sulfur carrier protein